MSEEKVAEQKQNDKDAQIQKFFEKEEVTIVVTDIGLGGLSVFDSIENRFSSKSAKNEEIPFKKVNLIYWNSQLPDRYTPHSLAVQIEKFDKQLHMIQEQHSPDMVLIACNTLSVIYDATPFYKTATIPILSIVGFGVDVFSEKLLNDHKNNTKNVMIIYGTTTTAKVGQHKSLMKKNDALIANGIDVEKSVILQGCKGGATTIQGKGADSKEIEELIDLYVHDSFKQIVDNGLDLNTMQKVYGCLCCTHYGYSYNFWLNAMQKYFTKKVDIEIVNPNEKMAEFITDNQTFKVNKFKNKMDIKISVFSPNVFLEQIERESIAKLLHKNSAEILLKCKGNGAKVLPKAEILEKLKQSQQANI